MQISMIESPVKVWPVFVDSCGRFDKKQAFIKLHQQDAISRRSRPQMIQIGRGRTLFALGVHNMVPMLDSMLHVQHCFFAYCAVIPV